MLPQYAAVVRRPGNVQMQPRAVIHKTAEEQSCRDRAAAVLGGIADISIVAVDQSLIFREGRHPPEAFAGAIRRARQCRIEVLVVVRVGVAIKSLESASTSARRFVKFLKNHYGVLEAN